MLYLVEGRNVKSQRQKGKKAKKERQETGSIKANISDVDERDGSRRLKKMQPKHTKAEQRRGCQCIKTNIDAIFLK